MSPDAAGRLVSLVSSRYVFPDVATRAADRLREVVEQVVALGPEEAAEVVTTAAQEVTDHHLGVRCRRSGALEGAEAWERHYAAEAVRHAGGIRGVSRLDGTTGLLDIAPYTSPVHLAEPYVRAAFVMLRGIDRLVVDLRDGRGGTPETVALICGHLLGREPVHLQDLVERDGTTQQCWTSPAADRLPEEVPVWVLTSAATFSGCEELAYNLQAQQRATVVGERTGGGAHPVEVFALDDVLEVAIPVARAVNAVTGTNWEGSGVVPDLECPAADALAYVHTLPARAGAR